MRSNAFVTCQATRDAPFVLSCLLSRGVRSWPFPAWLGTSRACSYQQFPPVAERRTHDGEQLSLISSQHQRGLLWDIRENTHLREERSCLEFEVEFNLPADIAVNCKTKIPTNHSGPHQQAPHGAQILWPDINTAIFSCHMTDFSCPMEVTRLHAQSAVILHPWPLSLSASPRGKMKPLRVTLSACSIPWCLVRFLNFSCHVTSFHYTVLLNPSLL